MYSTCIHCQRDLGQNALIEHLPIGRRIAFDEAAGRLWVICAKCSRWNLVPFESRWEAIESAEKLYRASRQRMSTGQVGLAKTGEGTDLVRIGAPLRPEMAAWRYGAALLSRRWKYAATTGPATVALTALSQFGFWGIERSGIGVLGAFGISMIASALANRLIDQRTMSRLTVDNHLAHVSRRVVRQVFVAPTEQDELRIWMPIVGSDVKERGLMSDPIVLARHLLAGLKGDKSGIQLLASGAPSHYTRIEGDDAMPALRLILPLLHEAGTSKEKVSEATAHLTGNAVSMHRVLFGGRRSWDRLERTYLSSVYKPRRLALEMLVHEESERRWLSGEILTLELEWRKANEIAEIADGLIRDPAIETALQEGQRRSGLTATD